jgi:hypothetical protein
MKTQKAFIQMDGKIGLKELPAIECIDKGYADRLSKQQKDLQSLLSSYRKKIESQKNASGSIQS